MTTPSRREQGKEERRARILAVTEELVRTRGDTEFSMRELADAAGVAFATPFNLFESKDRLLSTLLFRRVWPRQQELAELAPDGDPIGHIRAFTSGALATYTGDAELFLPLLRTVISPVVQPAGSSLEAAADLWSRCLEPARSADLLRSAADDRRLDRVLHITFRGTLLGWVRGEASADDAERDLLFAVGSLLAGAVVDEARQRVEDYFAVTAPG